MFFVMPSLTIIIIYFLAAVIPAVFLLRYIYRCDTVEKEPPSLLIKLLLGGIGAAIVSIGLEYLGTSVLDSLVSESSPYYTILLAFLVVAVVEEGMKLVFLSVLTWRNPAFNYRFDGVVYAVFVSLGFAAFENVSYVMSYGLSVAVARALLAVPAHMGFAVFMGAFYGRAKLCEVRGFRSAKTGNLILGYLAAVALHGFYDSCAMIGSTLSSLLFIAFVIVMYIVVIKKIKREAGTDSPV